jgi:HAD superfamily hydrolase (TIGR01549 family)
MTLNMIQALFFDLDGTLKISVPGGMETFLEYARQVDIEVDDADAKAGARWNHWYWAQSPALLEDLESGDEMTLWTRYSQRLLQAVGAADASPEQARAITERFADYAPHAELNDGVLETLAGLKAAGYTLALVSNRRNPLDQVVSDLGLEGFFRFTLAAGEIDIWKPDPGILLEAVARGNCDPATTVYVGDNYYADVVCAQAADLIPVLLDPEEIFPDADCRVIHALTDLLDWLV